MQCPGAERESEEENETVKQVIAEREEARKNKDWSKADEIRKRLLDMGIIIEDTPEGTRWYRERRRKSGG
jgi:cysteinyl-tRNA synthetase